MHVSCPHAIFYIHVYTVYRYAYACACEQVWHLFFIADLNTRFHTAAQTRSRRHSDALERRSAAASSSAWRILLCSRGAAYDANGCRSCFHSSAAKLAENLALVAERWPPLLCSKDRLHLRNAYIPQNGLLPLAALTSAWHTDMMASVCPTNVSVHSPVAGLHTTCTCDRRTR